MPTETVTLAMRHETIVREILHAFVPGREVRVFGSRVRGSVKRYADLDLVVMGEDPLVSSVIAKLREAFEESDLPFRVDIVEWAVLSEEFRAIVAASAVKFPAFHGMS